MARVAELDELIATIPSEYLMDWLHDNQYDMYELLPHINDYSIHRIGRKIPEYLASGRSSFIGSLPVMRVIDYVPNDYLHKLLNNAKHSDLGPVFDYIASTRGFDVALMSLVEKEEDEEEDEDEEADIQLTGLIFIFAKQKPQIFGELVKRVCSGQIPGNLSSLVEQIVQQCSHSPDDVAFVARIGKYMYRELNESCLEEYIRAVDKVFSRVPNQAKHLKIYFLPGSEGYNWDTVRRKVRTGKNMLTFIWDELCAKPGADMNELQHIASSLGIEVAGKTKRELCMELAFIKTKEMTAPACDITDADPWTMDSMGDIPPYRRYKVGNRCFDIFSLRTAIENGTTTNPFDRTPLPVDKILQRSQYLDSILQEADTFLENLSQVPINHQALLRQRATNLFSRINYAIDISVFLSSTAEQVSKVLRALHDFEVTRITIQEQRAFAAADSSEKKISVLLDIIERLFSIDDENRSSRILAVQLSLQKIQDEDGELMEEILEEEEEDDTEHLRIPQWEIPYYERSDRRRRQPTRYRPY